MPKPKYNEEEKAAIEAVIDMGLFVVNAKGDELSSVYGDIRISYHNGKEKEFKTIDKALKTF